VGCTGAGEVEALRKRKKGLLVILLDVVGPAADEGVDLVASTAEQVIMRLLHRSPWCRWSRWGQKQEWGSVTLALAVASMGGADATTGTQP